MKRLVVLVAIAAAACGGSGSDRLLVAAGTTLVDSGFMEQLTSEYERESGVDVDVIGEATAQVLALARSASVDVTITHAPELEAMFQAEDLAGRVVTPFASRFILAGPTSSGLDADDAVAAFGQVASRAATFVGREDGSGTSEVERSIWADVGIDAAVQPWYLATGQGMGLTLQVASERQGFVLAELGTFLTAGDLSVSDTGLDDPRLENPYTAMSVKNSDEPLAADEFVVWLGSEAGKNAILRANESVFGDEVVYEPR